jgi:HlyD family secretion protein
VFIRDDTTVLHASWFSEDQLTIEVLMTAQTRRRIFVISAGVLVAVGLVYGFLPKSVVVEVARARRGPLRVTVEEEGRTQVRDRFVVSAPIAGYLRRITLDVGDAVQKGSTVAALAPLGSTVIYPRSRAEAEAAVAAARAGLDAAKENARAAEAEAQYARERWVRMQNLAANGYISKDDRDLADSENKKAEANRLSAEAAVSTAKANLEQALNVQRYAVAGENHDSSDTVAARAPISGTVLKLHRQSAGIVNSGEPLLDIGDPRKLEVKVDVLSADAVKLHPGTRVVFERWGGDQDLEGRVRVVEPAGFTKVSSLGVEEQRVNVLVDLTSPFELWRRLGDGYRLDATFILWESSGVLQVPASSLFRKGDGWALFTAENKRAHLREIVVGHRNGLSAEILSGVPEGVFVIAHPDDMVRDGVRVRVRN